MAKEKAESSSILGFCSLGADTIVCKDEKIYEKPKADTSAIKTLTELSGSWHRVISAWHMISNSNGTKTEYCGHCISHVLFRDLTPIEIQNYVKTGEGRDKAGSYGIQGLGASLIKEIKGSYSNIVGLPLEEVLNGLSKLNIYPELS